MNSLLRADLYYYRKNLLGLLGGMILSLYLIIYSQIEAATTLQLMAPEEKLTSLFSFNGTGLFLAIMTLLTIPGMMKQCRFLQLQIVVSGDRNTVFDSKTVSLGISAILTYILLTGICFVFAAFKVDFRLTSRCIIYLLYQCAGFLRLLLIVFVIFILTNSIIKASICSLALLVLEMSISLFVAYNTDVFDGLVMILIMYNSAEALLAPSIIYEYTNPLYFLILSLFEIIVVWWLGRYIFSKKSLK